LKPQPVTIYGQRFVLAKTGGGSMTYSVTNPRTGEVLARQPLRFLAVAEAAKALRAEALQ
jgi:hypothetical protein